jgi:hypothetical protein
MAIFRKTPNRMPGASSRKLASGAAKLDEFLMKKKPGPSEVPCLSNLPRSAPDDFGGWGE